MPTKFEYATGWFGAKKLFGGGGSKASSPEADLIRARAAQAEEAMQLQAAAAVGQISDYQDRQKLAAQAEELQRKQANQPDVEVNLNIDPSNDPAAAQKRRKEFFGAGDGMSI